MIIKTKEFKEVANTILVATELDKANTKLELVAKKGNLYLNTTNKEFYVGVKFPLDEEIEFRAVIDAQTFLNLISGITAEEFELLLDTTKLIITVGRSSYQIPMIFENDQLIALEPITIQNKTVNMAISNAILKSILNVNSKELLKLKTAATVNEIQKLYYVDETGCCTFTIGACKNSFTLDQPIKLLLNDRIVKLFKLFDTDVNFVYGCDAGRMGNMQQKVVFQTENIYLAALVTCDDQLLNRFSSAYSKLKNILDASYSNKLVLSANEVNAALQRLLQFAKNTNSATANDLFLTFKFTDSDILISDTTGNVEAIAIENDSFADTNYSMIVNAFHLKCVMDSCKNEHITMNFGDRQSIVITHGTTVNYLPEVKERF